MEYLNCYVEVSDDSDENKQEQEIIAKVSLDNFIDDNTEIENNLSDYYGLTNITRSISDAKKDAFSESDIEDFPDKNLEARNYCPTSEDDGEIDYFNLSNKNIEDFEKNIDDSK